MPQATPQHAYLLKGAGEWEGTTTMFGPGAPEDGIPHRSETVHKDDSYESTFLPGSGAGTKTMVTSIKRVK